MVEKKTKTYKSVVAQINAHIKNNSTNNTVNYTRWYVGITCNVNIRKAQHDKKFPDNMHFAYWYVYTKKIANQIEAHFSYKGTKNAAHIGGATEKSFYVYAFKAEPTFWELFNK